MSRITKDRSRLLLCSFPKWANYFARLQGKRTQGFWEFVAAMLFAVFASESEVCLGFVAVRARA